jgi:REP element-mobilizing transposase RayT
MPSTHTSLHYHIIFSTKNRDPALRQAWRGDLHRYLGGVVKGLGGHPEAIGGVLDHVHLLVSLKPVHCLSDFMRELKKSSSAWVRSEQRMARFQWQEGYAAFTVSASACPDVKDYIENQEEHHRTRTFREEVLTFLRKSGVEFDERYFD